MQLQLLHYTRLVLTGSWFWHLYQINLAFLLQGLPGFTSLSQVKSGLPYTCVYLVLLHSDTCSKVYLGFPTLMFTWFSWHGPWQYSVRLVRAWIIRSTLCSLMYNPSSPRPPVVLPQIESRNCRVSHIKLYGLAWFGWLRKKFYPFKNSIVIIQQHINTCVQIL